MDYKVVFFDVDGTLLDLNMRLSSSTIEAITRLQAKGHSVVIATGREPSMFKHVMEALNIQSFVSCNGSYVVYEGEVIYRQPIDSSQLIQLNADALKNGQGMVLSNIERIWATVDSHPYIQEAMDHLQVIYPNYKSLPIANICYALLFCTESEERFYRNKYKNLDFIRWHEYSLDVVSKGGSKATGIKILLNHLRIKKENTIAFGDGLNDIEMLSYVGTGIAMGNANKIVKEAADFVTKDVTQDGIKYGLKKVGFEI